MAICGCPDAVIYALRGVVQSELDKLRAITDLTGYYNRVLKDLAGLVFNVVSSAVDLIPDISVLNPAGLVDYLTCPLLPLLFVVDVDALDPRTQQEQFRQLFRDEIKRYRREYEELLRDSEQARLIELVRKYVQEMQRIGFDEGSFLNAVIISATVLSVCGEEEYQEGPYQAFANIADSFAFSGGVPSSLDANMAAVSQKLLEAETKFRLMREVLL
jgi:hypothetical protein